MAYSVSTILLVKLVLIYKYGAYNKGCTHCSFLKIGTVMEKLRKLFAF